MSYERKAITFAELVERGALTIGDGYRAKNSELSSMLFGTVALAEAWAR
jgi:hypothetical protein